MGMDPAAALERVDRLHTALTQLVLGGGDLDLITAEVGRVLDLGVIVTATDGRPRAGSFSAQAKADLIAAHLVDETGRYRVERASGDGAPVASGRLLSLPVAAGGSDLARLLIHRTEGGIPEEDVHALERAAAVTALLIMREQAVTAVENKYQGDFLRDILLRRAGDRQYVVEHAQDFGWDLDRPAVVIAAEIDPPPPWSRRAPMSSSVRGRPGSPPAGARSAGRWTRRLRVSTSPPRWSRSCPPYRTRRPPGCWSPRRSPESPAMAAVAVGRSASG